MPYQRKTRACPHPAVKYSTACIWAPEYAPVRIALRVYVRSGTFDHLDWTTRRTLRALLDPALFHAPDVVQWAREVMAIWAERHGFYTLPKKGQWSCP